MTVLENAMVGHHCRTKTGVFGALVRLPPARREEVADPRTREGALGFFGTGSRATGRTNSPNVLSYANRRRLEMARAMATDPTLILLDEPTAG